MGAVDERAPRWLIDPCSEPAALDLAGQLGVSRTMAEVLLRRGHGAADAQLPGQIQGGRLRTGIDQPSGSAFIHNSHARKQVGQRRRRNDPPPAAMLGPERYDGPC